MRMNVEMNKSGSTHRLPPCMDLGRDTFPPSTASRLICIVASAFTERMRAVVTGFAQIKQKLRGVFGGELKISAPAGPAVHTVQHLGLSASCHRQWPTHTAFRDGWGRL